MQTRPLPPSEKTSLNQKVKNYRRRARETAEYLTNHPHEWGRFQSEFNQEINGIFRDMMLFEKEHLETGEEDKVYKLRHLFIRHFRQDFVRGEYLKWSLEKPFGYAGDHKIIDDIYQNSPRSEGFSRLYDNYFQMSAISVAVRNRKEDFKKIILDLVEHRKDTPVKIMDLASGPCRDVYEILTEPALEDQNVTFDCYDSDEKAIRYAKDLLGDEPRVRFFNENAVRLALKKDIQNTVPTQYDLIYSTGLFDYLDHRISVRLISNLRKLLNKNGLLSISDVRDKFSNPSIYFMEWVADWNLVYRDDDNFRNIFSESGFQKWQLTCRYEQQGIMQYIIAAR